MHTRKKTHKTKEEDESFDVKKERKKKLARSADRLAGKLSDLFNSRIKR